MHLLSADGGESESLSPPFLVRLSSLGVNRAPSTLVL